MKEFFARPKHPINIVGLNQMVPLTNGKLKKYINLDNAASTPSFQSVSDFIQRFLPYYSSVHRGTGFKSQLSTELYEQAHDIVAKFVGTDTSKSAIIFTKNATEAINKLSFRFPFEKDSVVLTTEMEHHSNDLPWRSKAKTVHVKVTENGALDLTDLDYKLRLHQGKVALVCVSGASNVTGIVQPIYTIAKMAHTFDAKVFVDAAQLAPHRKIDILQNDDPCHIDFIAFSAHKMYAPFGSGVLIGPKDIFLNSAPEYSGGGTVDSVTLDDIRWAGLPDREEAGSPNVIGALAMAKAINELSVIGMDRITKHEKELTNYAFEKLSQLEGVSIYGDQIADRVGVLSFNFKGFHHQEVASILSHEYGIGVRNGCFCAHPYVVKLLALSEEEIQIWRNKSAHGDKSDQPGLVRISFGCYNTLEEIDELYHALESIVDNYSKENLPNFDKDRERFLDFIDNEISNF